MAMRLLEALKVLEAATTESKERCIDTPEVHEAPDVLGPSATKRGNSLVWR